MNQAVQGTTIVHVTHDQIIEPTGPDTLAVLNIGGHEFTARFEPDLQMRPGDLAEFSIDLTKLVFFDPDTERLIA